MSFSPVRLAAAALMAGPLAAHAVGVADPVGDFLPTFGGTAAMTDLDVVSAYVTYNASTDIFTFTSTQAGAVGSTANGLYVWGINRGAGTAGFAANGLPGVRFDSVLLLRPDGTGSIGANQLPAGAVTISGNTITGVVSGSLLPTTGFAKADYTFNLWPRNTTFAGFSAISDFAPDNVNFTAAPVPEPAAWALLMGGIALLGFRRQQRR
jgi:hypothetical protein